MSKSRKERLVFIDFRLYFLGRITRVDLSNRFGIAPAVATRDFASYRKIAPSNLTLDPQTRHYVQTRNFVPAFDHPLDKVLSALSRGLGDGVEGESHALICSEIPKSISLPIRDILACISRAIHLGQALSIEYHSNSSGLGRREIVPFALVDNGLRWHVRGYDRKNQEFRDFVLTRISLPVISSDQPQTHENMLADDQWMRMVELELIPHPDGCYPESIQKDFMMVDGVLRLHVRAANAGYFLRRWNVDCSSEHSLSAKEHLLWLRNPLSLYAVTSAVLAPGFTPVK